MVQVPGLDPMIISSELSSRCATVLPPETPAEGSCIEAERAFTQIVYTIDIPDGAPTSVTYGACDQRPCWDRIRHLQLRHRTRVAATGQRSELFHDPRRPTSTGW